MALLQHRPPDVHSHAAADEAAELYATYRHPYDVNQIETLRGAMSERVDGSWAAGEVGDFEGRQSGKNDKIEGRELWGLVVGGEQLQIHTAHEFPTCNEAFLRIEPLFKNHDDLSRLVKRIRYGHGEQAVELKSGARLLYKARTGGGGRGFTKADLVVYDEAQHLKPEHVAASAATIIANPRAQLWIAGSGGMATSATAWKMRRRAAKGDAGRLAYTERTAESWTIDDDGNVKFHAPDIIDPLDHDLLTACHTGYAAGRTDQETLGTLLGILGFELFVREVLCIWDPDPGQSGDGPIDLKVWTSEQVVDKDSLAVDGSVRVGLDVALDRSSATFGLAGRRSDGLGHVAVRDRRAGTSWVVERAKELAAGHDCPITVPTSSPQAKALITDLIEAGVDVDEMNGGDFATACSRLIGATKDTPTIRHRNDPLLLAALSVVQTKDSADGGEVFSRKSTTSDISALTACTAAFGRVGKVGEAKTVTPMFAMTR